MITRKKHIIPEKRNKGSCMGCLTFLLSKLISVLLICGSCWHCFLDGLTLLTTLKLWEYHRYIVAILQLATSQKTGGVIRYLYVSIYDQHHKIIFLHGPTRNSYMVGMWLWRYLYMKVSIHDYVCVWGLICFPNQTG